jgi:mycothiol synthase
MVSAILATDDHRRLVGYAHVGGAGSPHRFATELAVDPDVGSGVGDADDLATRLLDAVIDGVAGGGGGELRLWVPMATGVDDHRAVSRGFRIERTLLQLRCSLPLGPDRDHPSDQPITTRPFRPGADEAAWLTVNNRAFASHPEQGGWDLTTLLDHERQEWFDPDGFLLLEEDGRLAGSCWTKVHAAVDPPLGEIYVIGVDPDFHGRGWGRALTRAGLAWLAGQGLTTGMLYVDADNDAAVSLYRSMGFVEHHADRAYVVEVAAG